MVEIERLNLSAERLGGLGRPFAWYLGSCAVTVTIALCTWLFALDGSEAICGAVQRIIAPSEAREAEREATGSVTPIAGAPTDHANRS